MCILVDANLFSTITNSRSSDYSEYLPVLQWVENDRGKFVHGGSHYEKEIRKHHLFRQLLFQMEHKGKTILVSKTYVDETERYLVANYVGKDFDDHHILAILLVSNCILVCTKDSGLRKLMKTCYLPLSLKAIRKNCKHLGKLKRPRIYRTSKNIGLLCDRYIVS